MFQKFFTNTLTSGFIKTLLHNCPLPRFKIICDGDYIIEDSLYIHGLNLIKCLKSGYINSSTDKAEYKIIKNIVLGEYDSEVTENITSKYSYYDPQTHSNLKKYLQWINSIYSINLLPFYNIFNYNILNNYKINALTLDIPEFVINKYYEYSNGEYNKLVIEPLDWNTNYFNYYYNSSDDIPVYVKIVKKYKIGKFKIESDTQNKSRLFLIPIEFNKQYTLAIDCPNNIYITPVLYSGDFINLSDEITDYLNKFDKVLSFSRFKQPELFEITLKADNNIDNNTLKKLSKYEKYLHLCIQLPLENESSIVILEGNYLNNSHNISYAPKLNYEYYISNRELNNYLLTNLSLLEKNDNNIYAFSDRLIEYLVNNTITQEYLFDKSIENVQKYLNDINLFKLTGSNEGIWETNLRKKLYNNIYINAINNNKYPLKLDINGYVDKDIEELVDNKYIPIQEFIFDNIIMKIANNTIFMDAILDDKIDENSDNAVINEFIDEYINDFSDDIIDGTIKLNINSTFNT